MKVERLRWLLRRLRSMPPAELPHRLQEQLRRRRDRGGAWLEALESQAPKGWLGRPLPGLHVDSLALDGLSTPAIEASLAGDAQALLHDGFELLGQAWPHDKRRAWGWDPATGSSWPMDQYTWEVDFRAPGSEGGGKDVKLAWELLRLQHLQLLGWRALGGCEESRSACLEDLESFCAANPPTLGIAWASGIELAARVASILLLRGLLGPFDKELRAQLWRQLLAHGGWLERYPSLHSSANNHLVAELGGLWLLGCLAPELPRATTWRRLAGEGLAREAARQVHPDGVGGEQSPTYQAFTMEWLLLCAVVARQTGHHLGPAVEDRLSVGARFLGTLLDAEGGHPRFGDEDEGVVLRRSLGPEDHVRSVVGAVACFLGRGALVPPGWSPDLRSLALGLEQPPGRPAVATSRVFPDGGYTWLRSPGGELELLFDHGPLGFAWTAGHGHADALSIWLRVAGRPVIVDAGTFRYNGAPEWRTWLRSTGAHNTVQVDGADQSEQSGPFNWGRRAEAVLEEATLDPQGGRVRASHDGYLGLGIIHRREVLLRGGQLEVVDHLEGEGTHEISLRWQLAPDLSVTPVEGGVHVMAGEAELLSIEHDGPGLQLRVEAQDDRPAPGLVSPAYNRKTPAPCLSWSGRVQLPATWTTTMRCGASKHSAAPLAGARTPA